MEPIKVKPRIRNTECAALHVFDKRNNHLCPLDKAGFNKSAAQHHISVV